MQALQCNFVTLFSSSQLINNQWKQITELYVRRGWFSKVSLSFFCLSLHWKNKSVAGACKASVSRSSPSASLPVTEHVYLFIVSPSHWLPVTAAIYYSNFSVCQALLCSLLLYTVSLFLSNPFSFCFSLLALLFILTRCLSSFNLFNRHFIIYTTSVSVHAHGPGACLFWISVTASPRKLEVRTGPRQHTHLLLHMHAQMVCRWTCDIVHITGHRQSTSQYETGFSCDTDCSFIASHWPSLWLLSLIYVCLLVGLGSPLPVS